MSLNLKHTQTQNLKQIHHLMMSRQMKQAIHLLQMPIMEMSMAIEGELELNPVLDYSEDLQDYDIKQLENESNEDPLETETPIEKELTFNERDFEILRQIDSDFRDHIQENGNFVGRSSEQDKLQAFLESTVCAQPSLFDHLMQQAKEAFETPEEISMAEAIIGNLDESGFLTVTLEEINLLHQLDVKKLRSILETIQTFDPIGVGATDLRQSLLLQLRLKGKGDSLAYEIVDRHFEDLLHNRIPLIQNSLNCSQEEIGQIIDKHISKLDLHPATSFSSQFVPQITPDAAIQQEGDHLIVQMNEDSLPPLRLNPRYLRMLDDENVAKETKDFIKQKILSAKWLMRNILQRNDTIERIAQALAIKQKDFLLNPQGKLVPMTMKSMAEELHLHESTIVRAISNKYIDTPKGILPLRFFFTSALYTEEGGDVSSNTVHQVLHEIINREDKRHPLSDEAISTLLKAQGIYCARRTVSKYRAALKIGNTQQRKKYSE